jgi:hypothetical protein
MGVTGCYILSSKLKTEHEFQKSVASTPYTLSQQETSNMKNQIFIAFVIVLLTACTSMAEPPQLISATDVHSTALAGARTEVWLTQTALPTITPTSTPTVFIPHPTTTPGTPPKPTVISPYEAEHKEIQKVIAAYFDKIYSMHNSYQVDGFGDTVSTSAEAAGFLKTELRKQAVDIVWARQNFLRYASYTYTLNYSEIVVFDAGQRARANFTEGNEIIYETSIHSRLTSHMSGRKHIIMLRHETDGWKIVYDVYNDKPHRSLYAPTPFPKDVLSNLDDTLMNLNKGQAGPALPRVLQSFIPSEPAQLTRWKEVETALAKKLLPQYHRDQVLCEWELTEKSEQKFNVWAVCMATITSTQTGSYYFPAASVPAVISFDAGGMVQNVESPEYGERYVSDVLRLFPNAIWKVHPDIRAMEMHLHWRRRHPTEPPLVVLNAEAILKVTPTVSPTP